MAEIIGTNDGDAWPYGSYIHEALTEMREAAHELREAVDKGEEVDQARAIVVEKAAQASGDFIVPTAKPKG